MNGVALAFRRVDAPSIYLVAQILQAFFEKLALGALNMELGLRKSAKNFHQDLMMFLGSIACHQDVV